MRAFVLHHQILALWLGVLLINVSVIGAVLWWAVRKRQFSDQDHARYLALEAGIPKEPRKGKHDSVPKTDKKEDECSS